MCNSLRLLNICYIILAIFLFSQNNFAQYQLVQSFIESNNTGDSQFGYSMSGTGDVNNDNYDDVAVVKKQTQSVYIYYGSNAMDFTADVILSGVSGSQFSWSISCAGDVNNDNFDDIIVGAPSFNDGISFSAGAAYIFYGGSSMDNITDVTIIGGGANYRLGCAVSGARDLNNDTYDDVIIGASGYSAQTGQSYIYFGGSSMDNVADVTMTGVESNSRFGIAVSAAGDLNNDTFDDVIVGAPGAFSVSDHTYIYYGSSSMDNIADVIMDGEDISDNFGYSVADAGDINNDSYDDVIIGAYGYGSQTGRIYIYLGGSLMDSAEDIIITGEMYNNQFGYSVSGAGDVNNDTYNDVIVGAYGNSTFAGRVYIYYGGIPMDNFVDVTLEGEGIDNFFGHSVSSAGDVNSDAYDDVIVGAYGYDDFTGRAYIYYGGTPMDNSADVVMDGEEELNCFGFSVSGAGDVNNDTYDDVIVGAERYNAPSGRAYIYLGNDPMDHIVDRILPNMGGDLFFGGSVSEAGDVNNDGYDDVLVGAYGDITTSGSVYIYFGGNPISNVADVILDGKYIQDFFGCSVSDAGDINNDGFDDVIVGAYGYNSTTGRVDIYYGGSSMDINEDVILMGEGLGDGFGNCVSGAGDVNYDGYDDVIIGAYRYNLNTGRAYVFYGGSTMDIHPDIIVDGERIGDSFRHSDGCN